jgi:GNAT superfamily N-acetyltransferase
MPPVLFFLTSPLYSCSTRVISEINDFKSDLNMKIEYLKDNPDYVYQIAGLIFKEWGNLRINATVDRYLDAIGNRLNTEKTPLTILAKSDNGDLIGFGSLVDSDMDINKDLTPWISGVYVIAEQRGKGVGRKIVERLEQIAIELGFNELYLFTYDKERFYSKLSWFTIKTDLYRNHNVTIMTKKLKTEK